MLSDVDMFLLKCLVVVCVVVFFFVVWWFWTEPGPLDRISDEERNEREAAGCEDEENWDL